MNLALNLKREEIDLIQACIRKEKWAQRTIYETYYGKMMVVCLRYSSNKDDARDLLHEGFIKVFLKIHKYQPGTSLGAWIYRIVVNTCIDSFRKSSRRRTEELDNVANHPSTEEDPIGNFTVQEILNEVSNLSPAYRTVFNLYVIEGYSHKEVAEELGITESTSRSNLVKARTKLKAALGNRYANYGK